MKHLIIMIFIIISIGASFSQIPEPVENWPYITISGDYSIQTTPRFLNPLRANEGSIYFSTVTGGINRYHLNCSPFANWSFEADSVIFSNTPIIVDLDFDGLDEIVTYGVRRNESGYLYSLLYIIDDDGSIFDGFPIIHNRINLPNVADYDNDGEYELIYYSKGDDLIYCIDTGGDSEPGWPIPVPNEPFGSAGVCGSVGDLDGDGTQEFLIKGLQNIYCYNHDGTCFDGFPLPVYNHDYCYNEWWGVTLGDVDYDGDLEIAVSATRRIDDVYTAYIAVYDHTGNIMEGWPRFFEDQFAWQMPVIADINGDNELELGFTMNARIYFIDMNGTNMPGWPATIMTPDSINWLPMSDLIVVDIDGDNDCEIFSDYNVFCYDNGGPDSITTWSYLFAVDHEGTSLQGYPINIHGSNQFMPPTFARCQETNQLFMGVYTNAKWPPENIDRAWVELYQFPDSTGAPDQWPMLGHDNLMTRNYNFVDNVTAIKDGEEPLPKNYILTQNYPNPFNSSTMINFNLPKPEQVTIAIYDILGRRVEELIDSKLPAGKHQVNWQADDYASGIYFYIMRTPTIEINRKMVLLK